jgi:hypothetical protein
MPSLKSGKRTSKKGDVSVEGITPRGVWLNVLGREYFLDYDQFPWFRNATIHQVQDVRLIRKSYLRWPSLDVDLELDCVEHPANYPLVYR